MNYINKSILKTFTFLIVTSTSFTVTAQVQKLPTAQLKIKDKLVAIEIAATEASRNYGLMHRYELDQDNGMLFVFDQISQPCFWMKNTPLPLSIAFIDNYGYITDIKHMQPNTLDTHCPSKNVKFALEVNQGWFNQNNIDTGTKVCVMQSLASENKYPAKKLGIDSDLNIGLRLGINCEQ